MRGCTKKVIAMLTLVVLLVSLLPVNLLAAQPLAINQDILERYENVSAYKYWTFQLKEPADLAEIKKAVQVSELAADGSKKAKLSLEVVKDPKTAQFTVMYPKDGYKPGKTYRLTIASDIATKISARYTAGLTFSFEISTDKAINKKPARIAKNVRYFSKEQAQTVHAVTIVGWDDEFSKAWFGHKPSGNGAFLVKDNQGEKFTVAVKLTTPGHTKPIPLEGKIPGYSSQAEARAGESFVSDDGRVWKDLTGLYPDTNVGIKAFAD